MIPKFSYLVVMGLVMVTLMIFHYTPQAALLGFLAFALGYLVKGKKVKA